MNYTPRFIFPWALWLLPLIPAAIWLGWGMSVLSRTRKCLILVLRTIILFCVIAALAGMELLQHPDKLAVFFVLDRSDSVSSDLQEQTLEWIGNVCETDKTSADEVGLIVFGGNASIELDVKPDIDTTEVLSVVNTEQTDVAAALRLAMAAFPQGYMRRVVLCTDGNETRGAALEEAKALQAAGIGIDVAPIVTVHPQEVRIREVSAPTHVKALEPFQLRVVANAEQAGTGTLRLYQRGRKGRRLLTQQEVDLQRGDNPFTLGLELEESGFYTYEAVIETDEDSVRANNEGRAYTMVQGKPAVLYVESDPVHSIYLEPALAAEGLDVTMSNPFELSTSLAQLQNYDAIVLSDVSATDIPTDTMEALDRCVRDLGIGLAMIGGPDSFGAGGFRGSVLEKTLPVSMDITQRRILPRGALVTIMHTCEIQDGNAWAREIALAALEALSAQDLMGSVGYLWGGPRGGVGDAWLFPLQPVGDKSMMRSQIKATAQRIGDMPDTSGAMTMAYNALVNADAAAKRIIMISDGDPGAPPNSLLKKLSDAGISVSTVCIAPHSPNDQGMLRYVAEKTGGQYYYVTNPNNLPQIFSREASVVRRGVVIEKDFVPAVHMDSELLEGLRGNAIPGLRGYVATSPKDNAIVPLISPDEDPILAHWRYGLGKSVAFTSDVTTRWAPDWVAWDGFGRFWAQTIRWATRAMSEAPFQFETRVRDGRGYVRIDAVDDNGRFLHALRPRGVVTGPPPEFERLNLSVQQTAPGVYEGWFPMNNKGVYMVNLQYDTEDGSVDSVAAGVALSYSPEYESSVSNIALLEQVAGVGGGRVLSPTDDPFRHDLPISAAVIPIWQYLLIAAACLFPIEVFFRRVMIDLAAPFRGTYKLVRRVPGLGRLLPAPHERTLIVTGAYLGAETTQSFGEVRAAAKTPAKTRPKKHVAEEQPEEQSYTQQLLAAKERALKKRGKRE